jgi:hypothetical protein
VNDVLVAVNNIEVLLHDIHTLICVMHIAKIPRYIFKNLKLDLEEEDAPPLRVMKVGATAGGGEVPHGSLDPLE